MDAARKLLRDTMEQKKWRAPQVADALGCSDDVVRRWLRGERRMQLEDIIKLAEISGADLNATFGLRPAGGSRDVPIEDVQTMIENGIQASLGKALIAALKAVGTDIAASSGSVAGESSDVDRKRGQRAPATTTSEARVGARSRNALDKVEQAASAGKKRA